MNAVGLLIGGVGSMVMAGLASTLITHPSDRVLVWVVVPLWSWIRAAAERLRPLLGALFAASARQP